MGVAKHCQGDFFGGLYNTSHTSTHGHDQCLSNPLSTMGQAMMWLDG
jgi:hypothetical protein